MEYATLNNGVKMPMAGIGTFLLTPDEAEASCVSAFCCRREDNSSERSSASSAGYGFIQKTSIVKLTMEILCRNEARFHEAHFVLTVQIL